MRDARRCHLPFVSKSPGSRCSDDFPASGVHVASEQSLDGWKEIQQNDVASSRGHFNLSIDLTPRRPRSTRLMHRPALYGVSCE